MFSVSLVGPPGDGDQLVQGKVDVRLPSELRHGLDVPAHFPIRGSGLDKRVLHAYTYNMRDRRDSRSATPCLCNALRQATRAVSRLYDDELRSVGLRTTQFSLLRRLRRAGGVRQRDLGGLTFLDETTLTRNLRPLIAAGWVAIRPGEDRREKLVRLTDAGAAKLHEAEPAWERAQKRLRSRMPKRTWSNLLDHLLPELTRLAGAV